MNHETTQSISLAPSRDLVVASTQEGLQSALKSRITQAIEKLLGNLKVDSGDSGVEKPKNISVQVVLRIPINDTEFETSTLKYQLQLSEKQQRYFLDPLKNLPQVVSKHIAGSVTGKCEVEIDIKTNQASDETASISESFSVTQEKLPIPSASAEIFNDTNAEMGLIPIGFEGKSADLLTVTRDIFDLISQSLDRLKERGLISNNQKFRCTLVSQTSQKHVASFDAKATNLRLPKEKRFEVFNHSELIRSLNTYLDSTKNQSIADRSLLLQVTVEDTTTQ